MTIPLLYKKYHSLIHPNGRLPFPNFLELNPKFVKIGGKDKILYKNRLRRI